MYYDESPEVVEAAKADTKHLEESPTSGWQRRWIANFTVQQGKLLKLLLDDERGEVPHAHRTAWITFLATEVATWLELLVDLAHDEIAHDHDLDSLRNAFSIWAKRHRSLQPTGTTISNALQLLADMRARGSEQPARRPNNT